jgi:hypothetical protein
MDNFKNNSEDRNLQKVNENGLFHNNQTLSFIHKKSEKISCGIYLVTNHLPNEEPIKWSIRKLSLSLIKDIFSLRGNFSNNPLTLNDIKYQIKEIISLLDLLKSAGLISNMNNRILVDEVGKILGFMEPEYNLTNSPETDFSENFFNVNQSLPQKKSVLNIRGDDENIDQHILERRKILDKGHFKGQVYKGHMSFKNMSLSKSNKSVPNKNKTSSTQRKELIIDLIKDKKEVTIKDIITFVKGYSEKTLQRDLVSLVKDGVLKREGERRWSRYLLA